MLEEGIDVQQIKPENLLTFLKVIHKELEDVKKETIQQLLFYISNAIPFFHNVNSTDMELAVQQNCKDKFFECMNDFLSKLLTSNKINDEILFVKVKDTIQKIIQCISQNLKNDNQFIRKCLLTLFNPENEFYSSEYDPPNRYFVSNVRYDIYQLNIFSINLDIFIEIIDILSFQLQKNQKQFTDLVPDIKERKQWFDTLKIGDFVDVVKIEESYKKTSWSHARITDKTELRIKLSFLCDSSKYDRWVEWNSFELRQYKSRCNDFEWRQDLKPNMIIDVCDTACVWYQSTILETRNVVIEGNQEAIKELYIGYRIYCEEGEFQDNFGRNYKGWTSKYDEWLSAHSPRIQQEKKMSKKLFKQASQNNSEKIIDDSNDIIFEYEYFNVKKIYAIHRVQNILKTVNSSYIQFINDFGDGLESILNLIIQSNSILLGLKDTNQELSEPIQFQSLCEYIQIIYSVSPFLFKQFCSDFIPKLNESIKINIYKSTQNSIKSFKKESINDMIKNLGIILIRYYSIGQKIEIQEELEYYIAKMCFSSQSVKQKTIGLQLITQIVQKYSKNSKKSNQLNEFVINYIQILDLFLKLFFTNQKNEIEKNKYIQQLFSENTHNQLLEKCTEFFIFLIEQNLFHDTDMKNMWKVIQRSHDDTRLCYYNLLKQVSKYLKASHIKAILEEINLKEDNKYKYCEVDILFEICFEEKLFQAERIELQNNIFNIIWEYINEFDDDNMDSQGIQIQLNLKIYQNVFIKIDIRQSQMKQTVDKFCRLIKEKKRESQIEQLRENLMENIKNGKNTYFSLEILESVMAQLNTYINNQKKDLESLKKECQNLDSQNTTQQQNSQQQDNTNNNADGVSQPIELGQANSNQLAIDNMNNISNISVLFSEIEDILFNEQSDIIFRLPIAQNDQQNINIERPISPPQSQVTSDESTNAIKSIDKNRKELEMSMAKVQIYKKQAERKRKCEELKTLVLENLKKLKSKQKVEQLKQSTNLIKSYIAQIEKRINFLSFINEECQTQIIDYELISELLIELIENQLVSAESEFFYLWLKRNNKKSRVIIPHVKKFFLEKVINDDHFISTFSIEGLDCFKSLFLQINLESGNMVALNEHPTLKAIKDAANEHKNQNDQHKIYCDDTNVIYGDYRVEFLYQINKFPENLEGIQLLWKITLQANNSEVSRQASIFLVNLYLKTTENLEDSIVEIRNSFIDLCIQNIKEKQYLTRSIQLIHQFLDYSEQRGIGNLVPHSAEGVQEKNTLLIKNQLPESANMMKIQNQFSIPCSFQKTLYQLRIELAQIFKINIDEILILIPGKNESFGQQIILKDYLNGYTLQSLEFSPNQVVIVQKQQKKWSHPVKLIKKDDQLTNKAADIIKEWFTAYSENGRMSMQNCAHFIESCTKDVCKVDDYRVVDVFKNWDSDKDGYLSEQDFFEFYRKGSKEKKETVMRNITAHNYTDDLNRIYKQKSCQDTYSVKMKLIHEYYQQVFQKLVFEMYEWQDIGKTLNEQSYIKTQIEKLLSRLPTCPYLKNILDDTDKISNIFNQSSKFEFLYILECIENKFFESQKEDHEQIEIEDIIKKLQTQHVSSQPSLDQDETKQSNIQNDNIEQKQSENQQMHQMRNENKIINVGLQNIITSNQNQTDTCVENDWIYNFFYRGLFEKLLQKFNFLMNEFNIEEENQGRQMIIEQSGGDESGKQQENQEIINIFDQIQIKLFQKYFKLFNKFISACLIQEYPYILYLHQYLGTIYINIEEIEEDLNKRSSINKKNENNNDDQQMKDENQQIQNQKNQNDNPVNTQGEKFIGPILPQDQQQVTYSRIQTPKLDKFQQKMIEYVLKNQTVLQYLMRHEIKNMTKILVNTFLHTLRQVTKWTFPYRNLIIDTLDSLLLLLYKSPVEFTDELKQNPNSQILFKEGLFCQKNKIIRQIFSFFLLLLIRQLNDKQWVIEQLISFTPQTNEKEEQAETCSQFFTLLCFIFSKYQEKIQNNGFNFDSAFMQVFETLRNICSKENTLSSSKDNLLNGYLQLTMTMLKNSNSISLKSEEEYVKFLIEECLFSEEMLKKINYYDKEQIQMQIEQTIENENPFSQQNSDQVMQEIKAASKIKCFHFDSRQLCYNQIIEICRKHPESIPLKVLNNMLSIVQCITRPSQKSQYNPEQISKSQFGYLGIKNLGSICYMNSMIQQLFACHPFVYSLLAADDQKEEVYSSNKQGVMFDDNILHQIQRAMTFLLLSIKKDYNPEGFCFSLKGYDGERTNLHLQQDTQEFFNVFVERIHTALENTPFRQIFDTLYGVTTITERTCKKCNKKTQSEQPFYLIPIKIKGEKTLIGSLDKTFRQESIPDYKCDDCKQIAEAHSQEYIKNLPNVLILNLFRISHNIETGLNQKDNNKIAFEQTLNLHQFMYSPQNKMEIENPNLSDYEYKLKGVVVHNGTADYGHYFSFIKTEEDKWLEFNDSNITEYNIKDMANDCFGQDPQEMKIPKVFYESQKSAYLLIYEKVIKNKLEFKIKNMEEQNEVIQKLGIKNPTLMSNWNALDSQCDDDNQSKNQKGSDYILKADYQDINIYITPKYQEQVAYDNYQFICERLLLNNTYLSFVQDIILTIHMPQFYLEGLKTKPLRPYLPNDYMKQSINNEQDQMELYACSKKYNYPNILRLIAYIYFNFLTKMPETTIIDQWYDLFYRFCSILPEISCEIFKEYIIDKKEQFWADILISSNQKVRQNTKQLILHLINIITRYYQIDLMQPVDKTAYFKDYIHKLMKIYTDQNLILRQFLRIDELNSNQSLNKYQFLRDFAESDLSQAAFLLKNNMIDKLLDFFLTDESPIANKYYTAKKTPIRTGSQFNPLLSTVYTLLCKQNIMKIQIAKNQDSFNEQLVLLSEDYEKIIMSDNLYQRAFKIKCDVNILGKILSHMSYKNYKYSYFIGKYIISGILDVNIENKHYIINILLLQKKYRSDDLTFYFELMSHYITIFDDIQNYRFEWIFGISQLKKDIIYEDYSLQVFLDDTCIEYISTLSIEDSTEQTKGLLSKIYECNIGYANSKEHYIVNKILYLMDVNENIFNYILTTPPPNYLLGYFIDFVGPYIQKNLECKINDAYSIALLAQIQETYKSIQQKIKNQEEQYRIISQDILSLSKISQKQGQQSSQNNQEDIQRLFDTYIYGQEIQQNRINSIENIQGNQYLSCHTIEYDVYYCQNKVSMDGKNLLFPQEVIQNDRRIDPQRINLYSNAYLLFNKNVKDQYQQISNVLQQSNQKLKIDTQKQNEESKLEEEVDSNQLSSKNLRFSSISSSKSNEAVKGQDNLINVFERFQTDVPIQSPVNQINSNTSIPAEENNKTPSLADTEVIVSQNKVEDSSQNNDIISYTNKDTQQQLDNDERKKKETPIMFNLLHLQKDNCIRDIVIQNTHQSHTYKVILRIQPLNQIPGFIILTNFKFPNMIERIIPPNSKCNILTLTKRIPQQQWTDYEIKLEVEFVKDTAPNSKQPNSENDIIHQIALTNPMFMQKQTHNPIYLSDNNMNNDLENDCDTNNVISCRYCTLKNFSNSIYCEVCNNPLHDVVDPPSPRSA